MKIPERLKPWIEARKRHGLSDVHIQMARELGMNPKSFRKLDNHRQERWKAPLPILIENLYFKRFKKERPDHVRTIQEVAGAQAAKKRANRLAKEQRWQAASATDRPAPAIYETENEIDQEIPL